jgi:hypothetical protein
LKKHLNIFLIISFGIITYCGCDAPRNNPLDPMGNLYSLEGTVQTFSVPYTPLENVFVYWKPGGASAYTNKDGKYTIENVNPVNGYLHFRMDGFRSDSIFIEWNNQKKISTHINMNSVPHIDSISLYTVVLDQFGAFQNYELVIKTRITDRDNDIDSVIIFNENLHIRKPLDYNITSKLYQAVIRADELNINDIEETIGLSFDILVKDVFNEEFNVGSEKVTRVIKEGAAAVYPNADSISSSSPNFVWSRHRAGYPFTYAIEVYTKDFVNPQLISRIENIQSHLTQLQSNLTLQQGEYFWLIWVIDNFQNRFRSTPATIIVP